MKTKYYTVYLEGIDKTGKDTLRYYIWSLNKGLNVFCRGYISLEAYNRKFNRGADYEKPYTEAVYVMLDVDKEDWEIRCAMSHEPKISYEDDYALFNDVVEELQQDGYKILRYDTSRMSPYQIAKSVVEYINILNNPKSGCPVRTFVNFHTDALTEEEVNAIGYTLSSYCDESMKDAVHESFD